MLLKFYTYHLLLNHLHWPVNSMAVYILGMVSAASGLAMRFLANHTKTYSTNYTGTFSMAVFLFVFFFISAWLCYCSGKKKHFAPCYFTVIYLSETSIDPALFLHHDVTATSKRDQTAHIVIMARPLTMHLTEEYLVRLSV